MTTPNRRDALAAGTLGAPVRIPKASAVVAANLRRGIVRGEFKVGDPLPNETELMELYHVSRPVVREALRVLESETLIEIKRGAGGGARFTRPSIDTAARQTALLLQLEDATLADLFDARAVLEPAAVGRLAASRDADAVAALRASHEEELTLISDPVGYPVHAARFHTLVIELAGNKTLAVIARLLQHIVEAHYRATFVNLPSHAVRDLGLGASEWHAELIDLIEDGDVSGAEGHWRAHLAHATETALSRLGPATVIDLLDQG